MKDHTIFGSGNYSSQMFKQVENLAKQRAGANAIAVSQAVSTTEQECERAYSKYMSMKKTIKKMKKALKKYKATGDVKYLKMFGVK